MIKSFDGGSRKVGVPSRRRRVLWVEEDGRERRICSVGLTDLVLHVAATSDPGSRSADDENLAVRREQCVPHEAGPVGKGVEEPASAYASIVEHHANALRACRIQCTEIAREAFGVD